MKNETTENLVSYKTAPGRGRPALGKVIRQRVVCVEIENLNNHKHVFVPMDKFRQLEGKSVKAA